LRLDFLFLVAFLVRCCGGLFATIFTARSKRAHASGANSIFFFSDFAMPKPEDFQELSKDEWLVKRSPIHPAKLHALGVITFAWNTCELHLLFLFCTIFKIDTMKGRIIAHDLGDIAISDRIREMLVLYERYESDIIENALDVYDICRQNRNSLTHFHTEKLDGELLLARIKGPRWTTHILPNEIKDFRRIADDIWDFSIWFRQIWRTMTLRQDGMLAPLPGIRPLPELLWKPPHLDPKVQKSPRPPSVPKLSAAQKRAKAQKDSLLKRK
jgi:hypothetical protein